MIDLKNIKYNLYQFIFGDITIEEFMTTIVVECNYKEDKLDICGRIIIDKVTNIISTVSVEITEYDTSNSKLPIEKTYRFAQVEKSRIDGILEIFREGNRLYGYNNKIKVLNIEDTQAE